MHRHDPSLALEKAKIWEPDADGKQAEKGACMIRCDASFDNGTVEVESAGV